MRLTQDQAQKLLERVGPMLRYLGKLGDRMGKAGFHPGDQLRIDVERAYGAVHALRMSLHYEGWERDTTIVA